MCKYPVSTNLNTDRFMKQLLKFAIFCVCSMPLIMLPGCNDRENEIQTGKEEEKPEPPSVTKYSISVPESEHGSAVATLDGDVVTEAAPGTVVNLEATPEDGYRFAEWLVESENVTVSNRAATEFIMPAADVSIKPEFTALTYYSIGLSSRIPISFVSVSVLVAGTEAAKAAPGDEVTISATVSTGYGFGFWSLGNADNNAIADDIIADCYDTTTTFLMPEYPVVVNCTVSKNAHWVRVTNDGNGYATVGMLPNQNAFYWGSNVQIVPVPNPGYKFKEWTDIEGITGIDPKANPLNIVTPDNEVTMKVIFEAE